MKPNALAGFAIAGALALCSVGQAAEDVLRKTFPVEAGSRLVMDVDRGNITVTPSDRSEVEIEVVRKLENVSDAKAAEVFRNHEVTFAREGREVRVQARFKTKPGWFSKDSQLQVACTVSVPQRADLDLRTSGGGIAVGDLTGQVQARTSAGSLKFGRIDGPVHGDTSGGSIAVGSARSAKLATSAGNIEVEEVAGELSAESDGGSVKIQKAGGNVTARTSAGNVRVGEIAGDASLVTSGGSIKAQSVRGKLDAETSAGGIEIAEVTGPVKAVTHGGSIQAALKGQPRGDCHFETAAGSIRLSLPENIAVDLDARTSAGSVTSELPVTVVGRQSRGALAGRINGGGPKLVLHSSAGSVTLKKAGALPAGRE
jgi:DUF4097 and DUF4098 domain-containing protein YvlB